VTIRAEIGRFDRFRTGKQMARFCGLSPHNASSGARQADAGLIRAGLRRLIDHDVTRRRPKVTLAKLNLPDRPD